MHTYRTIALAVILAMLAFAQDVLTNDAILRLLRANTSDFIILNMIAERPGKYSLGADAVVELKQAGATDSIIAAMMRRSGPPAQMEQPHATPPPSAPSVGPHRWSASDPHCESRLLNGTMAELVHANGFSVLGAILDNGSKIEAVVGVRNETSANVDVRPETFQLVVSAPKYRTLAYQDPDRMAKSIQRSASWKEGLAAFSGGAARRQTTSTSTTTGNATVMGPGGMATGTYNGTTMTTTSEPDPAAQQRSAAQIDRIRGDAANAVGNIQSTVLRANTVLPGQMIMGVVYFEHEKRIAQATLTVVVGGETFEFPFDRVAK
jgi:hypothetical protein